MNLLLPVDCNNRHEALLTTLDNISYWAFIELNEGQIVNCTFYKEKKDIVSWIEHLVVINEQEYLWQFKEENIKILLASTQRSIDEIVEAFLLKRLSLLTF